MAYPDGTAVIRYYPVELSAGSNEAAQIGLGLWTNPSPSGLNFSLASLDGDTPVWTVDEPGADGYLGTLTIPLAAPGGFSERAFVLLNESGVAMPISGGDLPIELFLSRAQGSYPGGYAGGIIQVGIYAAGDFVPLSSFELVGIFFPSGDVVPGGWEMLPPATHGSIIDGPPVKLLLDGVLPVSFFWTKLRKVTETP